MSHDNPKRIDYALVCDHCGELCKGETVHVAELEWDITSANKGESATLCFDCHEYLCNNP